jgi:hypothetical protein
MLKKKMIAAFTHLVCFLMKIRQRNVQIGNPTKVNRRLIEKIAGKGR